MKEELGSPSRVMTREQRVAWSDSSGKIFPTRPKKPRKVTHWEAWPGNWSLVLVFCCKWTTKRYKWFSLLSDWVVPLWASSTNICWFCFHFGFIKFTTPPLRYARFSRLQQCCWFGPVWLSHNKTAPALDTVRICSNWYEIIWRRLWLIRDFMAYHLCC